MSDFPITPDGGDVTLHYNESVPVFAWDTPEEAALSLRYLADMLEHGECSMERASIEGGILNLALKYGKEPRVFPANSQLDPRTDETRSLSP